MISQEVLPLRKTSSSRTARRSLGDEEDSCASDSTPPPVKRGITASSNSCLLAAITPMLLPPLARRTSAQASLRLQSRIAPGTYSVLRDGYTVLYFVVHLGSERIVVYAAMDAMAGARRTPGRWRRTTKAASHTPSLYPPFVFWDFGSLYQGVAASFWPAVVAAANAASATLRRQNVSAVAAQTAILHLPRERGSTDRSRFGQDRVR